MLLPYKNRFIKVFCGSLLLFVAGFLLFKWSGSLLQERNPLVPFIFLSAIGLAGVGYILYFWAHYLLAKAKGYSGWFILLGFINTFGILILFLLPDQRKAK
jgi:hypothetical protein